MSPESQAVTAWERASAFLWQQEWDRAWESDVESKVAAFGVAS